MRVVSYDVSLYDDPVDRSHSSQIFCMDGAARPDIRLPGLGVPLEITNEAQPYRLGKGWAYVEPNRATSEGPVVSGWVGPFLYAFGRRLTDTQLLRVAASTVLVK
jgi:hypothetical protein